MITELPNYHKNITDVNTLMFCDMKLCSV